MSFSQVFKIASAGMSAQNVRLNVTASNMANAGSVGNSEASTYRARHPVFATVMLKENQFNSVANQANQSVKVTDVIQSKSPLEKRYQPGHPNADKNGYIYMTNVNPIEEMANMISASRSYQSNVEIMNTARSMMQQTINVLNR